MEIITVSVNQAAAMIGIGRVTLYKHINAGRIEAPMVGGRRLVKVDSLRRLVGAEAAAA